LKKEKHRFIVGRSICLIDCLFVFFLSSLSDQLVIFVTNVKYCFLCWYTYAYLSNDIYGISTLIIIVKNTVILFISRYAYCRCGSLLSSTCFQC